MTAPRWFDIAYKELLSGVQEISGSEHNPRILEYHDATDLDASTDEVPWCSSFVSWCMIEAGVYSTRSARARSWLMWGKYQDAPEIGSVVILKRGEGVQPGPEVLEAPGHVGLFAGFQARGAGAGYALLLGGNQGDRVSIRPYRMESILGHRWPVGEGIA